MTKILQKLRVTHSSVAATAVSAKKAGKATGSSSSLLPPLNNCYEYTTLDKLDITRMKIMLTIFCKVFGACLGLSIWWRDVPAVINKPHCFTSLSEYLPPGLCHGSKV